MANVASCSAFSAPPARMGDLSMPMVAVRARAGSQIGNARCQMVGFRAKRAVSIPYRGLGFPAQDYVKEVDRIVRVAFPDSSRIEFVGNSTWRSRLRPVTFFSVSATPVCYLRVFYRESTKTLVLESDKLVLEFIGLPPGMNDDINLQFSLGGDLGAQSSIASNASNAAGRFHGSVSLGLDCDLPLPFSLMPEAIVLPVGDGILDRILGAMEFALLDGLLADYKQWCRAKMAREIQERESAATTFPAAAS
ncbi:uncharacterized protein LOC112344916 [Selaginella moellendorffii]|uniref:uncharacterized protein LOC112344916 n=1 Tax=Selaginella moellendorffii TaxID=88036 RepID=UPI000D1CE5B9|nr:uncharacterized protein LOC112344916 [Selaginella moellendorffii]XP_024526254.1 uncharacterized protein LOC112344916 [Selaginella moellendorffii]|eukprot:XP_024526253.1 uncharacterized protein LOC112344916 [Selaginella moellendorffii]